MIALYGAVYLVPATLGLHHVPVGRLRQTVDPADQNSAGSTVHRLFRVHHIAERVIQPGMNDPDLIIGHSSQAPRLFLPTAQRQRSPLHGCFFGRLPSKRSD